MHVCFVALKAYAVLTGEDIGGQIGGAEVQQVLIARSLARRGHRITFLSHDCGQSDPLDVDGITIRKTYSLDAGLPVIRFLHPRWSTLARVMREVDAGVYYQRGAGLETGLVARFCRRNGKPFVFATANDTDCDAGLPKLQGWREKALYKYGLFRADKVIVQTEHQARLMRREFGIEGRVIGSCAPSLSQRRGPQQAGCDAVRVLWVGRLTPAKRPELLVELASRRAAWSFDVVGDANVTSSFSRQVSAKAESLPNTVLHGPVPYPEMGKFYDSADVLVCTSRYEGFPNTFLEAWTRGLPVVSTLDPDGAVARYGLGLTGSSVEELIGAVEKLLTDPECYRETSARCLEYVAAHHGSEHIADAYESLLGELSELRTIRQAPREVSA